MVLPKIETYPLFRCGSGFIMDWIPYMYSVTKIPKTGVVLVMNLFVAVTFLAFGELANLLLVSLSVCSILGGIVRKWVEYKNYKGISVCRSYYQKGIQQTYASIKEM